MKSTDSTSVHKKARILIILPTLGNRLKLLRQTLESIKAQAPTPYDIVMVYPLSNSSVAKIAKEFSALSVNDPGSLSAAVNLGIDKSGIQHEYIGWIGDDDLIAPGSIKLGMDTLDQNKRAVVAFGYCDYINDEGIKIFTSRAGKLAPWIMTWGPNLMPCPGTIFRKSALLTAGKFDESNKYSMDLDMFLRLRKLGPFMNTKSVMASFRWHASSTTVANRNAVLKETELVKRKHLSGIMKPLSLVWNPPVRIATKIAAKRITKLARHLT